MPTDESFRVNVVLKVFMLALKAELSILMGPTPTKIKSLVMFSYIVSLMITAWMCVRAQLGRRVVCFVSFVPACVCGVGGDARVLPTVTRSYDGWPVL